MNVEEVLAKGERCGWLENAKSVLESCPPEFFLEENPWRASASKLYGSHDHKPWKWRISDEHTCERHHLAVLTLLSSFWLSREHKLAIAGWMLSFVLEEPPYT